MDKKAALLKILDQLIPIRELAKGLKILVEHGELGENELDLITNAVAGAVHTAKTEGEKEKLQKSMDILQRIKELEAQEKAEDIEINLSLF